MKDKLLNQDCSETDVIRQRRHFDRFRNYSLRGIVESDVSILTAWLNGLWTDIPTIIHRREYAPIYRATVNNRIPVNKEQNKRINAIEYLGHPKKSSNRYGRANLPNETIFYGAENFLTAISEVNPKIGDLITVSKWEQKKIHTLTLAPILAKPANSNYSNSLNRFYKSKTAFNPNWPNANLIAQEIFSFMEYEFSKVIHINHFDYFFSAYFASRILNKQHIKIDGLIYPSVAQEVQFTNIALKPNIIESHYQITELTEHIVTQVPDSESNGLFTVKIASAICPLNYMKKNIVWEQKEYSIPEIELLKNYYNYIE